MKQIFKEYWLEIISASIGIIMAIVAIGMTFGIEAELSTIEENTSFAQKNYEFDWSDNPKW